MGMSGYPCEYNCCFNGLLVGHFRRYPRYTLKIDRLSCDVIYDIGLLSGLIAIIDAILDAIQEDAAASCNQSPAFPGNAPSE